jgi:hypothetical protein
MCVTSELYISSPKFFSEYRGSVLRRNTTNARPVRLYAALGYTIEIRAFCQQNIQPQNTHPESRKYNGSGLLVNTPLRPQATRGHERSLASQ